MEQVTQGQPYQAFKRLKRACIDARIDKAYTITREELDLLAEQVEALRTVTEKARRARIAAFRKR